MKIIETVSGSVTSTKQFIGGEERDGSGSVTKRFFSRGVVDGANSYFFLRDHLGSVNTVTDTSGIIQASYSFDPFGRRTTLIANYNCDFGFAGYYQHARSSLNLLMFRAYSPPLARWLSHDPINEAGGINLYAYAANDPVNSTDISGLAPDKTWQEWAKDLKDCHCLKHSDKCCEDNKKICGHACDAKYTGAEITNVKQWSECHSCCKERQALCEQYKESYPKASWESCFAAPKKEDW